MSLNPMSMHSALTPKKSNTMAIVLIALGIIIALGSAAYGYFQQARVEQVVIAVRPIPYGQQITADDLATIEVPLHRPQALAGMSTPSLVIGRWAAHEITTNDIIGTEDLLAKAPERPVYPNGEELGSDMVPLPFSTKTIGPLTDNDTVNIGFSDEAGDPALCQQLGGQGASVTAAIGTEGLAHAYACRLLSSVQVLYIENDVAYLEVTPYQAHAVWAIQAAGLPLWGERYGATSTPLMALDRLDVRAIDADALTAPTETLKLEGRSFDADMPGSAAVPGDR